MTFDFIDKIPHDLNHKDPIFISGIDTLSLNRKEYLIIDNNGKSVFEIRYECHYSPFKQAIITDNILAVGHEEYFYLFDLRVDTNILRLKMDGYFGHLHLNNQLFYIADACGLYCIDKSSSTLWTNNNLGVDGVIIHDFSENKISGSGEWDPPGGWREFIVDENTGALLK